MRRVYAALLVIVAVVLSGWLAIHYDVLTFARAFLTPVARWLAVSARLVVGPAWQWITVASRPIVQQYLMRRAEAPLWNLLTEGAIVLVGTGTIARISARARASSIYFQRGVTWWRTRHRLVRWGVGSCAVFGAGFLGFGLFILPVWIPVSGRILQSVHFFWFDQIVNRWIGPSVRRFRRLMRTNPFWRTVRRPHRVLPYWLLLGIRRAARVIRGALAWRHPAHARTAIHTPAAANLADPGVAQ